jgi:predicted nucleic acid-binding protein
VKARVLVDTGPLVAYFCARDAHHSWAVRQFAGFAPPSLTCEPVVTETCFLLERAGVPASRLLEKVRQGAFRIGLHLDVEITAVDELMARYRDLPMSLADACLVRLAEVSGGPICTLDSDFLIYRKHGPRHLDLIAPTAD